MKVKTMRALIKDRSSEHHDFTMDVKLINYDYVFGIIEGKNIKVKVPFDGVEFIYDYDWEKSIVKNRDILRVSLGKTSSMKFYGALLDALEQHFEGEIKNLAVLSDINERARKGYWYKRVEAIANGTRPVEIRINGRDYGDFYNINIEDMDLNSFKLGCRDKITNCRQIIKMSLEKLKVYEKALYIMEHPEYMREYKAIGGR